jgi:hypothetical protein
MEFIYSIELAFPIHQLMVLLTLSTLVLLFGRIKLALMINYLFTIYWGYFFNRDVLQGYMQQQHFFSIIYFGLGLSIAILAMLGFMFQRESS